MPRDNFSDYGRPRNWVQGKVTAVAEHLTYPEEFAPKKNGNGQYPRGVRLEMERVKRGKTAPRFDEAKDKAAKPKKSAIK